MAPLTGDRRAKIEDVLNTIGLTKKANLPAGILAHGEKQWLELGMLMAQDPELLLIDEPVAGMSPRESEAPAICSWPWPASTPCWSSTTT